MMTPKNVSMRAEPVEARSGINQIFPDRNKSGAILLLLSVLLLAGCSAPGGKTADQNLQPDAAVEKKIKIEFRQALALMQANDMQGAAKKFHDLIERYPQMAGAWANLGLIHIKTGEWEKAKHALQQALSLNPKHAPAYNYLGVVERNLGQFRQAEQAYKKSIDADPGYAIAWLNLGILYDVYMDKPVQALPRYEQYQQLNANADKKVKKWIVELKRRIPKQSSSSRTTGDRPNG